MADKTALDLDAILDRHADERRTERAEDIERENRSDRLISEALARREQAS
jgi:hypothetical protein